MVAPVDIVQNSESCVVVVAVAVASIVAQLLQDEMLMLPLAAADMASDRDSDWDSVRLVDRAVRPRSIGAWSVCLYPLRENRSHLQCTVR